MQAKEANLFVKIPTDFVGLVWISRYFEGGEACGALEGGRGVRAADYSARSTVTSLVRINRRSLVLVASSLEVRTKGDAGSTPQASDGRIVE